MSIQTNRTLGGVGACLTIVGVVSTLLTIIQHIFPSSQLSLVILGASSIVGTLAFVGFILNFIAMHGFSRIYQEHRIFSYLLYGLIGSIVSAVVVGVVWFAYVMLSMLSSFRNLYPSPNTSSQIQSMFTPYITPFVVVMSVVVLVWVIFNYKAYNLLANKSGIRLFSSAAKLFILGGLVNLAVGIAFAIFAFNLSTDFTSFALVVVPGGLVQYVAWILVAKAFFRIQEPSTQAFSSSTEDPAGKAKNCPNCNAQIDRRYVLRTLWPKLN